MIIRYCVDEKLPFPARNALSVVQAALKVNRHIATSLIHDGAVTCRGRSVLQPHAKFDVGDQVEICYVPPTAAKQKRKGAKSGQSRFEVIHDDPSLLVVNKPAELLTLPTPHRERHTLKSQIDKWLASQGHPGPSICVHRLDRGVSGVLVFAKDSDTAQALRSQFSQRKPKRKYVTIVCGHLENASGTFRSHLATDEQTLHRYSVANPDEGELAITHYHLRELWRDASLCEVTLETGRRNQIRVHFAEAGHPILGDPRYRPEQAQHPLWPYKRIALHAELLGFKHPDSDQFMEFTAPWPQEFRDLRRRLNTGSPKPFRRP